MKRRHWTPADDARMRELYPHRSTEAVARQLKRSVSAVYGRADKLSLNKSEAYLASPDACRLRRGDNVGAAFRYPKGHVPANKGLRRPGFAPGRMSATQFKKGAPPHTTLPLGSEVTRKGGYVWVKVSESRVPARRNWEPKQRAIYEATRGPVPPKHIVIFRDGDRKNFAAENLALLSMRANAARNTIHNYPPEIVRATQLRAVLVRAINKRQPPPKARLGRPPKQRHQENAA